MLHRSEARDGWPEPWLGGFELRSPSHAVAPILRTAIVVNIRIHIDINISNNIVSALILVLIRISSLGIKKGKTGAPRKLTEAEALWADPPPTARVLGPFEAEAWGFFASGSEKRGPKRPHKHTRSQHGRVWYIIVVL